MPGEALVPKELKHNVTAFTILEELFLRLILGVMSQSSLCQPWARPTPVPAHEFAEKGKDRALGLARNC